jgi:hypothetical protein
MVFRFILLLFVGLPFLSGCDVSYVGGVTGSGIKASETRDVPAFTGLELHGSANVIITVGKEQSVTVEVDDNLMEIITTEVKDNELVIGSEESYSTRIGVNVTIQVPELKSVAVSGSGNATLKEANGQSLDVRVEGSGNAMASGDVENLTVSTSGSGNAKLSELTAKNVSARVSGSGNVRVHATETLEATVNGSGDVRYIGSPQVTKKVSGSGSVRAQ